jgi:hypothetical protein
VTLCGLVPAAVIVTNLRFFKTGSTVGGVGSTVGAGGTIGIGSGSSLSEIGSVMGAGIGGSG